MELDYKQMCADIGKIVNDDWHDELAMAHMNGEPYSQAEAEELAKRLGRIYYISHCITCAACQSKYALPPNEQ